MKWMHEPGSASRYSVPTCLLAAAYGWHCPRSPSGTRQLLTSPAHTAAPLQVLGLFQTNEEIMPYAVTYCSIRALCVPASMFMVFCQAAFR
jgi:hypothetical protein